MRTTILAREDLPAQGLLARSRFVFNEREETVKLTKSPFDFSQIFPSFRKICRKERELTVDVIFP